MKIRRVAEIVDDFKGGRLLAGDAIRINRVHNGELVVLAEFAHNSERIIKVAVNRDNLRAVRECLD